MLPREPVLNAMRRPATFFGTHAGAVIVNLIFCLYAFLFTNNLWMLAAALPIHGVCWLITQADPFAFRILKLYFLNAVETLPNRFVWKASSRDPNSVGRRQGKQ